MDMDQEIKLALQKYKHIAVVGLSSDPGRPSFGVTQYMQKHGYKISPVRPGGGTILNEKVYENLSDLPPPIEIIDVFRKSDAVAAIVDEAIKLGAKVLWLQEGVMDPVAEEKARAHGIQVFSDMCIMKEHARLS